MSLSACEHCYDTPCSCGHAYWFMSMARLEELVRVTRKVLGDRKGNRRPPGHVREELERRAREAAVPLDARNFGKSLTILADALKDPSFPLPAPGVPRWPWEHPDLGEWTDAAIEPHRAAGCEMTAPCKVKPPEGVQPSHIEIGPPGPDRDK